MTQEHETVMLAHEEKFKNFDREFTRIYTFIENNAKDK